MNIYAVMSNIYNKYNSYLSWENTYPYNYIELSSKKVWYKSGSVDIPRKIWLAGLITKVLSITLLHPFMPITISTVCPFTVWGEEESSKERGAVKERGGEMTLLIALALPQASVMPIQHFRANLIEHKQEENVTVVGKQMR